MESATMGLKNAPSVFQAVMNQLFSPFLHKYICVYLDDLLIYSRTREEHYMHLRKVFELLGRAATYAYANTSAISSSPNSSFSGHIVSASGLQPDTKKSRLSLTGQHPRQYKMYVLSWVLQTSFASTFRALPSSLLH